jgi:hypothetical protein
MEEKKDEDETKEKEEVKEDLSSKEKEYDKEKEHHEKHEIRIDNDPDNKIKKLKESVNNNLWKISTIILAVIVLILLMTYFNGKDTSELSGVLAGEKVVKYLNSKTGGGVEYVSNEDIGNLYQVTVKFQNQNIPVFISKDGKYFIQGAIPITINAQEMVQNSFQEQPSQNISESNKSKAELDNQ